MVGLEPYHPYIAVLVTIGVFLTLLFRRSTATDVLFLTALMVVTFTGIIKPEQALQVFGNPALMTIGALLVVAAALRSSGVLDWIGRTLLGKAETERGAMLRLVPALLVSSAFLLNTALVAMAMPVVIDWCRRRGVSPSRLLLPVSYLAILGGVCTLIGTSTTLVANVILQQQHASQMKVVEQLRADPAVDPATISRELRLADGVRPLSLFELGYVGIPCGVAGGLFLLFFGRSLLSRRADIVEEVDERRREYLVEMRVLEKCPLIAQTVQEAGLRSLPGLFLIEIDRDGDVITPVTPNDRIHAGDRLVFTGVVSTIVDLEKIPGFVPVADHAYEHNPRKQQQRNLTEVVLSRTSPIIGMSIREANFRRRYQAAVVAVHRSGVRLTNKVGDIGLEPGDTLLLQTRTGFEVTYQNSRDFYLVSRVEGSEPRRHHKFYWAAGFALLLIVWFLVAGWSTEIQRLAPGLASPAIIAMAIALAMIVTRCVRMSDARSAIDLSTLFTIAGALGVGMALNESGAAAGIAEWLVNIVGKHPMVLLIVMYLLSVVFTETITNNAVVTMLLPLAIQVASKGDMSPRPLVIAVTLAASLSFMTPVGYQTNLMVMGPGGYRSLDYLKCGAPLAILVAVISLTLIPIVWPF
ncbi:MAG: di/tricarboxylate transporter [Pirellulaceae bacterium]|jgi:di/tricarboxylate transporter